ncbi:MULTISPECIES: hypothetical protein [unclassified Rhizobium]|nr:MULTISPECIES: hypothetical protein [unclassified Rhizobium]
MDDNRFALCLTNFNRGTWAPLIRDQDNLGWDDPLVLVPFDTGKAGERR